MVGAYGILAKKRAGGCGVSEDRDGEGEAALHLINGRELPVLREPSAEVRSAVSRDGIHGAQREPVPDVATRSLLGIQIVVVLRNARLEHRRAEVRRVGEVLCIGVVGQQAETVRVPAADIDISGVMPAARAVPEDVDSACWESSAR